MEKCEKLEVNPEKTKVRRKNLVDSELNNEIKKNMNTSVLAINFPRELTGQRNIFEIFGRYGEIVQSRVILAGAKIPNYLRVSKTKQNIMRSGF